MPSFKYLIVGGGMTADAAAQGIREVDKEGSTGLVSAETVPPYNRPPLTKGLWKGKPFESVWRKTESLGVTMQLGRTVRQIDPQAKTVTDDRGTSYSFEKLLIATGGSPRRLAFGGDDVIYFRNEADYKRLRTLADERSRFAVIGGGFIGSEIAAALAMNGKHVVLIFPEEGIGRRMFSAELSGFLNDYYRQKGVEVALGTKVTGLEKRGEQFALAIQGAETKAGQGIVVDGVVAGVGIVPNVELAKAAGLKADDGIWVDAALRTSNPDIYAAGDVASFENPALGRRMRVEHEDNANTMGKMAGQSMAGEQVAYDHLPYFYSDLFDLGYEAVGEVDSRLETVADWQEPFKKGVTYYLRDGRVRGVLLWNVWEQVDAARRLIAERGPFKPADLKGKLPA
jgi:3-phenylpropionate/trans-cinnamate dioxygenase ferredoxin reductase component